MDSVSAAHGPWPFVVFNSAIFIIVAFSFARPRHSQYVAFATVMVGFLFQWPTLPTLLVFPPLLEMYRRLARREERDASAEFGDEYARYAAVTPGFAPRLLLRNTQTMPSFHGSDQRNIVASEGQG